MSWSSPATRMVSHASASTHLLGDLAGKARDPHRVLLRVAVDGIDELGHDLQDALVGLLQVGLAWVFRS